MRLYTPGKVAPFRRLNPRGPNNLFFDPSGFALAPLGSIGNAPRTVCCGPGINNFDLALHKTTRITEDKRVEFRAEVFNAWNHTQFLNPDGTLGPGRDFARVRRARDPRLVQLALKFYF